MQPSHPHHARPITRRLVNHPQLEIIKTQLGPSADINHVEYRVYNFQRLNNGRVLRGDGWGLRDLVIISIWVWFGWKRSLWLDANTLLVNRHLYRNPQTLMILGWIISLLMYIYTKCITIIYESIIPLPNLGTQLSTIRGLSFPWPFIPSKRIYIPVRSSNTFVPLSDISTIILNQALFRFSVRYYLGIVKKDGQGVVVAFNNIRPGFEVLREVYHGAREIMFEEYATT
ncbi:hypothetical protein L486_06053 [Kwoniella mangroviensis CBS 10435]|uniref:Phosphatidylinositol N-acetylglucosaminyltransferase subunit H conserved domain-containing protein n=1 Tax=Kwoniella mangroviensis CBS 10435 TaxID=1331196 RepID=A0A1B9IKN6_9TREE|nr:uncharacterized protein I203_05761 [Kwoniella mangroviensis CBS 8507]OCF56112.1 hypothetical protein L486_06053 [Kwoniella mangroviensis CBS 10435]OCF65019.1 hypothetical protein I203_05761 [Kwoniella mangroviensis CBS 8507]OCF78861.1 hypothetical protein I204_00805 [Kwoniella mangroviensis CBS 8886]